MSESCVLASACCCGVRCRWHGRRAGVSKPIREMMAAGIRVLPVCPEVLGGLSVPRPPVRTVRGRVYETDEDRVRLGRDLTDVFLHGAHRVLLRARRNRATDAYLFRLSPSCAPGGITGRYLRERGITVHPIW